MCETLEAKLRNQLSPIYGLVDMILLMEKNQEIKELIIEQAKQALDNKDKIDFLLTSIEAKTLNKPDAIRNAFEAGRNFTYDDFDDYITKINYDQCQK